MSSIKNILGRASCALALLVGPALVPALLVGCGEAPVANSAADELSSTDADSQLRAALQASISSPDGPQQGDFTDLIAATDHPPEDRQKLNKMERALGNAPTTADRKNIAQNMLEVLGE